MTEYIQKSQRPPNACQLYWLTYIQIIEELFTQTRSITTVNIQSHICKNFSLRDQFSNRQHSSTQREIDQRSGLLYYTENNHCSL